MSFYLIGYMCSLCEHVQIWYFVCFVLALSMIMGVVFLVNLFILFLFYEVLFLVIYLLVGHKETDEVKVGVRKYVIYFLGVAKLFLMLVIILIYNMVGTLEFRVGGILLVD